jgi:hypothetical protein
LPTIAEAYRSEGLLPYNELPDITQPGWRPDPLVIERDLGNGQHFLGLGLAHLSEVGNPHYNVLTERSQRFIGTTATQRRTIFNEGGLWPQSDTLEDAYEEGGEAQWLQNFGRQNRVRVISPEPLQESAPRLLEEGFTKKELTCQLFIRQAPQYGRLDRRKHRGGYQYYMEEKMHQLSILTKLNFNPDFSYLVGLYEGMLDRKFDRNDTQFFYEQSVGYMLKPTTRIQEITIASNMLRDVHFVQTIQAYVNQGISVEWACGWTHVRALQARLMDMTPMLGNLLLK